MPRNRHLDPSTDAAPESQAVVGSLSARVSSAVLGSLLRVVRFLGRALEGITPNF